LNKRQNELIDLNTSLENKVKERTHEMSDLYNNAPCGYYSIDANGVFIRVNDTELKWLGCSRDEVIGKMHFSDLLDEAGKKLFQISFPKFIAAGYIQDLEFNINAKNGQSMMVSVSATALKNEQGNLVMTRSVMHDISERKKLQNQINLMAYYDALTQLPNRRLLLDRLSQELQTIKRGGLYGALIFIDLDNFKPLNDLHGHDSGDFLLREAGRRIKACLREMDTVARIGCDEFVALISQLEGDEANAIAQAGMVAEKIRLALAEPYRIDTLNDQKNGVTVKYQCFSSIGVAVFAGKTEDIDVILKVADTMMYEAKNLGRNQVRVNSVVI
jgi:diguanylate cyclase (GGDEF)-like protein/PAS domain S-box-containing protein